MDQKDLHKKRESYRNQFFVLGLEIIAYFAAPAVLGVFLGKKIDSVYGTDPIFLLVCLGASYVFSWTIFLWRLGRVKKGLDDTNKEIKKQSGLD